MGRRAGVEPKFKEFTGTAEAAFRLVWSLNFKRRHLTPSQAVACGLEFEELLVTFTAEAKVAQKTGKGADGSGGRGKKKTLPSQGGKVSRAPTTATKLARQLGVGTKTVERGIALKKASPEKLAEVKAGTKSLSQAGRAGVMEGRCSTDWQVAGLRAPAPASPGGDGIGIGSGDGSGLRDNVLVVPPTAAPDGLAQRATQPGESLRRSRKVCPTGAGRGR